MFDLSGGRGPGDYMKAFAKGNATSVRLSESSSYQEFEISGPYCKTKRAHL